MSQPKFQCMTWQNGAYQHLTLEMLAHQISGRGNRNAVRNVTKCSLHWMTQTIFCDSTLIHVSWCDQIRVNPCKSTENAWSDQFKISRQIVTHLLVSRGEWSAPEASLDHLRNSKFLHFSTLPTRHTLRPSLWLTVFQKEHEPIQTQLSICWIDHVQMLSFRCRSDWHLSALWMSSVPKDQTLNEEELRVRVFSYSSMLPVFLPLLVLGWCLLSCSHEWQSNLLHNGYREDEVDSAHSSDPPLDKATVPVPCTNSVMRNWST